MLVWIKDNWVAIFTSLLGTIVFEAVLVLAIVLWKRGLKDTLGAARFYYSYLSALRRSGITDVICDRNEYDHTKFGRISYSIDRAQSSLLIASISLITGIQHEGILPALKKLIERGVNVVILLRNPKYQPGLDVLAASFDNASAKIREDIAYGLSTLESFRSSLAPGDRRLLSIRVYDGMPFASAILIDALEAKSSGIIRIETKPYKAPMGQSWGFEVKGIESKLYKNFRQSWLKLLDDSIEFDSAKHL